MDITKNNILDFALNESPADEEAYIEDEHYDGQEYYDEEGYDDAAYGEHYEDEHYNYPANTADSYEDKMALILQELADLRRAVSAANPQIVPVVAPVIAPMHGGTLHSFMMGFPFGNTAAERSNNELHIYNELARIREDLSKTQSSHAVHVETGRLKDQMRQEAKINENQLNEEIRRLSEKLANLQKT